MFSVIYYCHHHVSHYYYRLLLLLSFLIFISLFLFYFLSSTYPFLPPLPHPLPSSSHLLLTRSSSFYSSIILFSLTWYQIPKEDNINSYKSSCKDFAIQYWYADNKVASYKEPNMPYQNTFIYEL